MLPLPDLHVALGTYGLPKSGNGHRARAFEVVIQRHDAMVIADAIPAQVANAIDASDSFGGVQEDDINAYRVSRLADLLRHDDLGGSKAALGRALGYKSGAYVRQLIDLERPVTEKLVAKIEAMKASKFAGWFARATVQEPQTGTPWPLRRWTPDQWSAIDSHDRAVMEDAAMSKWRELQSERTARPFAEPEKRQANGK